MDREDLAHSQGVRGGELDMDFVLQWFSIHPHGRRGENGLVNIRGGKLCVRFKAKCFWVKPSDFSGDRFVIQVKQLEGLPCFAWVHGTVKDEADLGRQVEALAGARFLLDDIRRNLILLGLNIRCRLDRWK